MGHGQETDRGEGAVHTIVVVFGHRDMNLLNSLVHPAVVQVPNERSADTTVAELVGDQEGAQFEPAESLRRLNGHSRYRLMNFDESAASPARQRIVQSTLKPRATVWVQLRQNSQQFLYTWQILVL
ncbi:hypothetical protein [Mycolicibacterium iranicum]|uniref:hypothetical protein n=1 Tax=Mycolicibacterium iranicum TaxID=912594 RepID=UPI001054CCCE|nr:hypothetical protein [Mycolicibacterium iranicum]